jgi:hypothetical protein
LEREVARLGAVPSAAHISVPPTLPATVGAEFPLLIPPMPGVDLRPYIDTGGATLRATAMGRLPTVTTTYAGQVVVRVEI